jgi:hypothetical protein
MSQQQCDALVMLRIRLSEARHKPVETGSRNQQPWLAFHLSHDKAWRLLPPAEQPTKHHFFLSE